MVANTCTLQASLNSGKSRGRPRNPARISGLRRAGGGEERCSESGEREGALGRPRCPPPALIRRPLEDSPPGLQWRAAFRAGALGLLGLVTELGEGVSATQEMTSRVEGVRTQRDGATLAFQGLGWEVTSVWSEGQQCSPPSGDPCPSRPRLGGAAAHPGC